MPADPPAMSPDELPELWIARYERDPGRSLVRVGLGFTAYLADPEHWANGGAYRYFDFFRARIPGRFLCNMATSTNGYWRTVTGDDMDDVAESLRHALVISRPRHLFHMRLQNDGGAESVGFTYAEVDPRRADRSAVLQITFPQMSDPRDLIAHVIALLGMGPIHSLIGGLAFRWDWANEGWAFNRIYSLASRYIGIDIQKWDEMAWKTPRALPGTNWLTYVGAPLAERAGIDLEALAAHPWQHGVQSGLVQGGVMVQAGESPVQGDLNRLRLPEAYMEVARVLGPYLAPQSPKLWGPFFSYEHSDIWFRRLVDPTPWAQKKTESDA